MKNLDAKTFKEKIKQDSDAVIIDVRTPEEEAEGLIENSLNMNLMEPSFPAKVMDLDKSKKYYVYCRSGGRSATACQFMEKNGLTAFNLEGGIQAWNTLN
jgi:rhodanese-related sulfurtransferase